LRQRIAALATRIHCSNNEKEDFIKTLERLGKPMKMPIQDVKTRWNSVFQMLDRFMELQEVIVLFSTTESGKDFSYSHNDWKLASDVKNLLEPAFEATVDMSGEYYVSGSKIIPMAKSILSWYARHSRRLQTEEPGGFNA
jgi:hypothetical protein